MRIAAEVLPGESFGESGATPEISVPPNSMRFRPHIRQVHYSFHNHWKFFMTFDPFKSAQIASFKNSVCRERLRDIHGSRVL